MVRHLSSSSRTSTSCLHGFHSHLLDFGAQSGIHSSGWSLKRNLSLSHIHPHQISFPSPLDLHANPAALMLQHWGIYKTWYFFSARKHEQTIYYDNYWNWFTSCEKIRQLLLLHWKCPIIISNFRPKEKYKKTACKPLDVYLWISLHGFADNAVPGRILASGCLTRQREFPLFAVVLPVSFGIW